MVRAYGTNNLPDCSNMCHESSGTAMTEQIGIGKGAVTLESLEQAELIVIAGQNPGTNAPRMLTHLEKAKQNGAVIVAVNPLPEAGLIRFKNPQTPRGLVGPGHGSRRRLPPDPARRRPRAVPRRGPPARRGRAGRARHRRGPGLRRGPHRGL